MKKLKRAIVRPENRPIVMAKQQPGTKKIKLSAELMRNLKLHALRSGGAPLPKAASVASVAAAEHDAQPLQPQHSEGYALPSPQAALTVRVPTPAQLLAAVLTQAKTTAVLENGEAYYTELAHIFRLLDQGVAATVKMPFIKKHLKTSHSTVYREVERGNLPEPIKVGHASSWQFSDIEAYRLGTLKNTMGSRQVAVALKKSLLSTEQLENSVSCQRLLAPSKHETTLVPMSVEGSLPNSAKRTLPNADRNTS